MAFDVDKIRQQFAFFGEHPQQLYLDNAATTQKPNTVLNKMDEVYRRCNANVHRGSHMLSRIATEEFELARQQMADFIGAERAEQVIWTKGATEAINLVAQSWGQSQLQAGDVVLVSTLEHHANIVPWQQLCKQVDARLVPIPLNADNEIDLDAYAALLESLPVKMVALTMISNALGTINPVDSILALAKRHGARVLLDAAQAVAHQRINVVELNCDFLVFSGHKMYGPTGIGVLYGKRDLLETMPPYQFGGEMIEQVSFAETRFNTLPFKFEAGTPNISAAIGLGEAARFVQDCLVQGAAEHEMRLLTHLKSALSGIPGLIMHSKAGAQAPLLSFTIDDQHSHDIATMLDQSGIAVRSGHHCAMPLMQALGIKGTIRVSLAMYNTLADVDRFVTALKLILQGEQQAPALPTCELATAVKKVKRWQDKYRLIMQAGRQHQGLNDVDKHDDLLVPGCESLVWLRYEQRHSTLLFTADADSRIVKGLLVLLLERINGLSSAQLEEIDLTEYFRELQLFEHLSPSRGNGLLAIINKVQLIARHCSV